MAYGDFKDIKRRTASDKILRDKAFNIAKNPKYDGYQRGLASMVYIFFNKNSAGGGIVKDNGNDNDNNGNNDIKQNDIKQNNVIKTNYKKILKKKSLFRI